MENSTGPVPEHDEKTGSFAPRTSGAPTSQKKSFRLRKLHFIGALGGAIVLLAILYPTVVTPCVLDLHDMHLIDPKLRPTVLIENEGIRVYDRLGNQLEL